MVLLAALSTGGSTPDCHWGGGYGGCYGGGYGGCYGGGYGDCYGGCYGGYGWGAGYVTGYGNYGCYGCSGHWNGWWTTYSCYGCYGCHGCYGCYGCYGCTGYAPVIGQAGPGTDNGTMKRNGDGSGGETSAKARLVVSLPADAKLYIDDKAMKTKSARRTFRTPALQPGQTYYYVLRTEVVREGRTYTETKRVLIRPGEVVRARFDEPTTAVSVKKQTQ
jgi:uncharacterized protein (TIGR03000 family)